jgi:hypothetical protein
MSPSDRVAHLYPQIADSLLVAFYDSQGYGDVLTRLHTGRRKAYVFLDFTSVKFTSKENVTSTD